MRPVHHRGGEEQTCTDQVPGRRITAIGDDGEGLVAVGHANMPGELAQPIDEIAGFAPDGGPPKGAAPPGDLHDPRDEIPTGLSEARSCNGSSGDDTAEDRPGCRERAQGERFLGSRSGSRRSVTPSGTALGAASTDGSSSGTGRPAAARSSQARN